MPCRFDAVDFRKRSDFSRRGQSADRTEVTTDIIYLAFLDHSHPFGGIAKKTSPHAIGVAHCSRNPCQPTSLFRRQGILHKKHIQGFQRLRQLDRVCRVKAFMSVGLSIRRGPKIPSSTSPTNRRWNGDAVGGRRICRCLPGTDTRSFPARHIRYKRRECSGTRFPVPDAQAPGSLPLCLHCSDGKRPPCPCISHRGGHKGGMLASFALMSHRAMSIPDTAVVDHRAVSPVAVDHHQLPQVFDPGSVPAESTRGDSCVL